MIRALPSIDILRYPSHLRSSFTAEMISRSPNSDEALSLLSIKQIPDHSLIEKAAASFLDMGVGKNGEGWVIIRSGALGAYVASRNSKGRWIAAYWSGAEDSKQVVDVTGMAPFTRWLPRAIS